MVTSNLRAILKLIVQPTPKLLAMTNAMDHELSITSIK